MKKQLVWYICSKCSKYYKWERIPYSLVDMSLEHAKIINRGFNFTWVQFYVDSILRGLNLTCVQLYMGSILCGLSFLLFNSPWVQFSGFNPIWSNPLGTKCFLQGCHWLLWTDRKKSWFVYIWRDSLVTTDVFQFLAVLVKIHQGGVVSLHNMYVR